MTDPTDAELRSTVLQAARRLLDARLNSATAGNVSVRHEGGMLITPSGLHPHACTDDDIVMVAADGRVHGRRAPSSEWRFHADLYGSRAEVGAIVHTHSPFATALACQRRAIPAFHYSVARFGGSNVRCASYAAFGSVELSRALGVALDGRCGCLMANHGATVLGRDVDQAVELAFELELLSEVYWRSLQGGTPVLLQPSEMDEVLLRYRHYGQPSDSPLSRGDARASTSERHADAPCPQLESLHALPAGGRRDDDTPLALQRL